MLHGLASKLKLFEEYIELIVSFILSDTKIEFAHEVLSNGDLLIEDLNLENSGNFTCSIINMHGQDSITHTLTVHGKLMKYIIILLKDVICN